MRNTECFHYSWNSSGILLHWGFLHLRNIPSQQSARALETGKTCLYFFTVNANIKIKIKIKKNDDICSENILYPLKAIQICLNF